MKPAFLLAIITAYCLPPSAYCATCATSSRARVVVAAQSAVVVSNGFIVVPFAVPVAVPSYVQYQAAVTPQGSGVGMQGAGEETKAEAQSDSRPQAPEPRSLVASSCAKCHSGPTPKAKLDLSGELLPAVRLRSIARILSDDPARRMPKGKSLDAQAIGLLIQELSRAAP